MNAPVFSNEQAAINARREISRLKSLYMDSLNRFMTLKKDCDYTLRLKAFLECQKMASEYFNYVETFVGDSDLLGAHDNWTWVTGFAEDCSTILTSLVKHFKFIRAYSVEFGLSENDVNPSPTAYANMQRMVVQFLDKKKSKSLRQIFVENNLPTRGFNSAGLRGMMNFNHLPIWGKLGVFGSIASIVGVVLFFIPEPRNSNPAMNQSGAGNAQIQNNSGVINILPPQEGNNPRVTANALATAASTQRNILGYHMPADNPPQEFIEAETYFHSGRDLFVREKYIESAQEFSKANAIYEKLLMIYFHK